MGEGAQRGISTTASQRKQCLGKTSFVFKFKFYFFNWFLEKEKGGRERERKHRERHITQLPPYMPWPGTEPTAFWCIRQWFNQLNHLPRARQVVFNRQLFLCSSGKTGCREQIREKELDLLKELYRVSHRSRSEQGAHRGQGQHAWDAPGKCWCWLA